MAVVADLVINKPMGWSPPGIEFKRAHLYDVNPVGVGAMGVASLLSIVAYLGWLGPMAQAFSALIALVTAFVASPLIAWWTKGATTGAAAGAAGAGRLASAGRRCTICEGASTSTTTWRSARPTAARSAHGVRSVLLAGRALPRPMQSRRRAVGRAVADFAAKTRLLPARLWRGWTPSWATS